MLSIYPSQSFIAHLPQFPQELSIMFDVTGFTELMMMDWNG